MSVSACASQPFSVGGNQLLLQLNGPSAWAAPGGAGSNVAMLSNISGDLRLLAAGGIPGLSVQSFTGNVGVGNYAPAYALDVSGNMRVMGALTVTSTLYTSNVNVLGAIEVINAYTTHSSNLVITNVGTGPALLVTQTEATAQPVAAFYAGIGSTNPAMMVTSAGQVGVGKSTAAYALDVSGWASVSGLTTLGSNVGIGKTNPAYALDVSWSVNVSGAITVSGTTVIDASNYFLGLNKYAFAFTSTPISPTTRSAWIAGGLSVSIPISGTYLITYNGRVNNITTSDSWWKMGLWNNRTSSYLNITWGGNISYSSGIGDLGASGSYVATSLLTSDTIRLDYYVAGSGSSTMNFGGDTNGVTTLCALKIA